MHTFVLDVHGTGKNTTISFANCSYNEIEILVLASSRILLVWIKINTSLEMRDTFGYYNKMHCPKCSYIMRNTSMIIMRTALLSWKTNDFFYFVQNIDYKRTFVSFLLASCPHNCYNRSFGDQKFSDHEEIFPSVCYFLLHFPLIFRQNFPQTILCGWWNSLLNEGFPRAAQASIWTKREKCRHWNKKKS